MYVRINLFHACNIFTEEIPTANRAANETLGHMPQGLLVNYSIDTVPIGCLQDTSQGN